MTTAIIECLDKRHHACEPERGSEGHFKMQVERDQHIHAILYRYAQHRSKHEASCSLGTGVEEKRINTSRIELATTSPCMHSSLNPRRYADIHVSGEGDATGCQLYLVIGFPTIYNSIEF